jgi:VWFA-related protein
MRIAGAIAAVCLAVATYASTPAAQTGAQTPAPPQGPQATFRAATNLVEVDVVVLDKDGRFVPGLTADDLDVFEDGKRQVVQQFYLVSSAMAGASGRTETEQRPTPGDPRGRRIFVFLFDEGHMSTESLTRVKVGVERFLGTQFAPGDIGGVFMNNAMYRGRLTTSKVELVSAIRSVVPAFDNRDALLMPFRDFPQIPGEADAVRIDYGDRRLLDELTARACERNAEECARAGGTGQVHNQIEDKAKQYVRDARVQTSQTVRNLNTIATNLSTVPGRKTVIFLSDGFFVDEVRSEIQQIAGVAGRGGTTIYTIRGRGSELVGGRGVDVMTPERGVVTTHDTTDDGPEILASGTGGFVVRNLNDISRAIGMVARDTSNYYVMGYQPDNGTMDGKLRRIEVRPKTTELKVRARKGYVASPLPPQQSIRIGG